MRTVILGNSGSGKTTLSRQLAKATGASVLSMDQVAFVKGAQRCELGASIEQLRAFLQAQPDCVVEGCYGDLTAAVAQQIELLLFLNPGIPVCLAHCNERPWEPDKFESPQAQEAMRQGLLDWVASYGTREDEYGYRNHKQVFDAFSGRKCELTLPDRYLERALQALRQ